MNRKLKYHFGNAPIVWVPFWGISKLRRRGGGFAGEIPGDLRDYDLWYSHALSESVIAELADSGFNLAVLPFSLGGSAELERDEQNDFEHYATVFHRYGIKVLTYLQYQNLMQESNSPTDVVWSKDLRGAPIEYTCFRRTACQSGAAFKRYLKTQISESIKRGADGIWIDNSYLKPCSCELCTKAFMEYLREQRGELLEFLNLRPETVALPKSILCTDPVARAFFDFNIDRNIKLLSEFKTALEECNSNALFCSNSMLYRGADYSQRGVDFYRFLALHDIVYLENKLFPGWHDNLPSGNFHGFTAAAAAGSKAVSGAWKKGNFDSTSVREPSRMPRPEEIDTILLEPVVFNGICGAFWAIREMPDEYCQNGSDKMKLYFEYPPMTRRISETLAYIKNLPPLNDMSNAADIGVLYHSKSLTYDFVHHQESLFGIEKLLAANNFQYRVIFSDNWEQVDKCRLLILPGTRVLSNDDVDKLNGFAEKGIKVLVLGADCGMFDENNFRRTDSPLPGISIYTHSTQPVENGNFTCFPNQNRTKPIPLMMNTEPELRYPDFVEHANELAAIIDRLAPRQYQICGNVVSTLNICGEKLILQLFSYDVPVKPQSVTVVFRKPASGSLYRPDHSVEEWNGVKVEIPDFGRHALLSFKYL